MRVIVAQKGAREHFLAARALHRQGMLAGLVTDWYAFGKQKAETLKAESKLLGAARAARAEGIPDELVYPMRLRSLFWKWKVRKAAQRGCLYEGYLETDAAFARAVARMNLPEHDVFFGYSYASLEAMEMEKQQGKLTVLDQIDPGPVEFRLVAEEMARFPELAGPPPEFPTAYYERNRREWELADVIVVNSEWTRGAIVAEGAKAEKIQVLPLAFERNAEKLKTETLKAEVRGQRSEVGGHVVSGPRSGTLRVLWLGQVNVRKGIHYLMEAARLLENERVHFDVVGAIGILPSAVTSAPRNMTFHGPVSRDGTADWYQRADIFVLPTLSDGFAITQLEAMAHCLPVIVTPNCGRVVEEGVTGFVIPARDPLALANVILRFVRAPDLGAEMAPACRDAVKGYSIDTYGRGLVEIIEKCKVSPGYK